MIRILSLLIATVKEREEQFKKLLEEFERQIKEFDLIEKVEICFIQDNKEITIGDKRNQLLDMANGRWIVFFDDDDWPSDYYLPIVVKALEDNDPDCLGFKIKMTTNGTNVQWCDHSLRHKKEGWQTAKKGFDYIRAITHFNPVRSVIARHVGFPIGARYAEDRPYADEVTKLCLNEYYLDIPYLFEYRYSNKIDHNKKYGIKK